MQRPDTVTVGVFTIDCTGEDVDSGDNIVKMAYVILEAKGVQKHSYTQYEDGTIHLREMSNGDFDITRQPMPILKMPGNNPVIMVRDNNIIRTHGEQRYIVDHMVNMVLNIAEKG